MKTTTHTARHATASIVSFVAALLLLAPAFVSAQTRADSGPQGDPLDVLVADLHALAARSAALDGAEPEAGAAISVVRPPGSSAGVIACQGWYDCAWLSWYCGQVDGITGFEGECYVPSDRERGAAERLRALTGELATINALPTARREAAQVRLAPRFERVSAELTRTVGDAAGVLGVERPPHAAITCTHDFFVCTCDGAFDCAWLAWYCSAAGGISGFDDECYLPSAVPGAQAFARRIADHAGR